MAGKLISQATETTPASGDMIPIARPGDTTARYFTYENLVIPEYASSVSQTGTDAPTETVIYNNTGATGTWSYVGVGNYRLTFSSAILTANKTIVLLSKGGSGAGSILASRLTSSAISVWAYNSSFSLSNSVMTGAQLLVRIYPT